MRNILKSENFRIRKSGVTLGVEIFFGVTTLLWILLYVIAKLDRDTEELFTETGFSCFAGFPSGSLYLLIVAFFVGAMLAGDYSTGAIKQIASRGVERRKIILGQYITVSVWVTVITLIAAVLRAVFATAFWGTGEDFTLQSWFLTNLGWIAVIWSYTALAVLIAHLVRSMMLSLVIHIAFLIGGNMVTGILWIFTEGADVSRPIRDISRFIHDYWIMNVQEGALDYSLPVSHQLGYMGLLALFGVVCMGLGIFLFEKRDVA